MIMTPLQAPVCRSIYITYFILSLKSLISKEILLNAIYSFFILTRPNMLDNLYSNHKRKQVIRPVFHFLKDISIQGTTGV